MNHMHDYYYEDFESDHDDQENSYLYEDSIDHLNRSAEQTKRYNQYIQDNYADIGNIPHTRSPVHYVSNQQSPPYYAGNDGYVNRNNNKNVKKKVNTTTSTNSKNKKRVVGNSPTRSNAQHQVRQSNNQQHQQQHQYQQQQQQQQQYNNNKPQDKVSEEFHKMRYIIQEQRLVIQQMKEENVGLQKVTRHQSRQLLEYEQARNQVESSIQTSSGQVNVLLERVRRLNEKLEESKSKIRQLENKNRMLRDKYSGSNNGNNNDKKSLSTRNNMINSDDIDTIDMVATPAHSNSPKIAIAYNDSPTSSQTRRQQYTLSDTNKNAVKAQLLKIKEQQLGLLQQQLNQNHTQQQHYANLYDNNASITEAASLIYSDYDTNTSTNNIISKLQKSLRSQRLALTNEISSLKKELALSYQENDRLKEEVAAREKESRQQVIKVKELRQICEDLTEGNRRLLLASKVYEPVERMPVESSRMPAQPVHPNSNRSNNSTTGGGGIRRKMVKGAVISYDDAYINASVGTSCNTNDTGTFFITQDNAAP